MFVTHPIGIIGEEEAANIMKDKGFQIVEHNWRMGHLEVDLIAENKNEIVFIEVKARTTSYGNILPEEYVDETKRRRMIAAANAYIKHNKIEKSPRFDIIGIIVDAKNKEILYRNHLENVFIPQMRTTYSNSFSGSWKWQHRGKTIGRKR